jgi:hypothetical protein
VVYFPDRYPGEPPVAAPSPPSLPLPAAAAAGLRRSGGRPVAEGCRAPDAAALHRNAKLLLPQIQNFFHGCSCLSRLRRDPIRPLPGHRPVTASRSVPSPPLEPKPELSSPLQVRRREAIAPGCAAAGRLCGPWVQISALPVVRERGSAGGPPPRCAGGPVAPPLLGCCFSSGHGGGACRPFQAHGERPMMEVCTPEKFVLWFVPKTTTMVLEWRRQTLLEAWSVEMHPLLASC